MAKKIRNDVLIIVLLVVGFLGVRELLTPAYAPTWGYGGVKLVQQGTGTESIAAGATDTVAIDLEAGGLTAVANVNKTEVMAWATGSLSTNAAVPIAPHLSSTTNLNLYISHNHNATVTVRYTWQLTEYH